MGREKRGLELSAEGEEHGSNAKRQKAPCSCEDDEGVSDVSAGVHDLVIVETLKVDSLQKPCSSLEPVFRRVASEEVERALAKLGSARLGTRSSPKRIEGPDGRNLQLHFHSRLSLPLFTGGKVEGEQGAAIHVVLLDANTGHVVTSGPESSAKLNVVVLEGDFNNEDDWTDEDFESHVVKEREGKGPLLTGDLQVSLKEGVGTLGELTFTDNSSWKQSRKFRLGLKIASGFCEGIRIREAKTEPFAVKDHRSELNKKHYPPVLKDDVWRLEKIGKDGSFHKRLNKAGIYTVEDFLRLVVRDSQKLRNILGSGMSNKMWKSLVGHAKTCVLSGKYYVYYSDDTRNFGAIFNNIYEFVGLIAGGQYYLAESLGDCQKVFVDTLVKKAYDNWMNVIEYDGKALLNFTRNEVPSAQANYSASYDQQHVSQASLSVSVPSDQSLIDTGVTVGVVISSSYGGNQSGQCSTQTEHVAPNAQLQYDSSCNSQNQFIDSSQQAQITRNDSTGLVLVPSQQPSLGFQSMSQALQPSNLNSYDDSTTHQRDLSDEDIHMITHKLLGNEDDRTTHQREIRVDDFFTEEEISMRSHKLLENEDTQHLLRVHSMGGTAHLAEDGFSFSLIHAITIPLTITLTRISNHISGKVVVGWLKIKAAMRWGIFIRKKAAERRAQLVELEE
ncbi:LOW QUALITY PROTEIN: calmodulin-binding protein 60 D-like [Dioscorea cayenensis subsp. rotundata]|uniref:LOW QUALITY PROTEIN: calmodulin-binding protein 60 D-like n=1 Tax=Dioscorea cayennensis subsp. rotundata TaxID=55577 RepID=A0AB40BWS5_DIOCR|nr:LOW QUALITY PROTEIN: calmodulin-binding protein 60 D-like [Dioscorea cayenensis subsp. rotundata]